MFSPNPDQLVFASRELQPAAHQQVGGLVGEPSGLLDGELEPTGLVQGVAAHELQRGARAGGSRAGEALRRQCIAAVAGGGVAGDAGRWWSR
jgi:hypothetical protein